MDLQRTDEAFPPTPWSSFQGLSDASPETQRAVLHRFVSQYWPPVYASLRRRRFRPEEAAEITQAFFSDVVLTRNLVGRADPERGRLRSLLLTSLDNYLIDQKRRQDARGDLISLDPNALEQEEDRLRRSDSLPHAHEFDRRWAFGMLDEAMRRCEAHYRDGGNPGHWTLFETRIVQPAITGNSAPSLAQLHEAHGFRSAAHAASGIYQVRQRIRTLLREVVAETVANPRDVEEELRELLRLISSDGEAIGLDGKHDVQDDSSPE